MRFYKAIHFSFLCVITLVSVAAQAVEPPAKTCSKITATGGPNYAPATWLTDNEIIGYMPDMVRTIGERLDIPVEVLPSGQWKRVLANVEAGQFDIVMGLLKNTHRLTIFDYTAPIASEPIVVASFAGSSLPYDGSWNSLTGHQGAMILGVSFGTELNKFIRETLKVRITPDYAGLFKQFQRGRLDYVIASDFALQANAADAGVREKLNIYPKAVSHDDIYMAFSKRSACKHYVDAFSAQIEHMKKTGEIAALIQKYRTIRLSNRP